MMTPCCWQVVVSRYLFKFGTKFLWRVYFCCMLIKLGAENHQLGTTSRNTLPRNIRPQPTPCRCSKHCAGPYTWPPGELLIIQTSYENKRFVYLGLGSETMIYNFRGFIWWDWKRTADVAVFCAGLEDLDDFGAARDKFLTELHDLQFNS